MICFTKGRFCLICRKGPERVKSTGKKTKGAEMIVAWTSAVEMSEQDI